MFCLLIVWTIILLINNFILYNLKKQSKLLYYTNRLFINYYWTQFQNYEVRIVRKKNTITLTQFICKLKWYSQTENMFKIINNYLENIL